MTKEEQEYMEWKEIRALKTTASEACLIYAEAQATIFEKTSGRFYVDNKEVEPEVFDAAIDEAVALLQDPYRYEANDFKYNGSGFYEFFEEERECTIGNMIFKHIPVDDAFAKERAVIKKALLEYDSIPAEEKAVYEATVESRRKQKALRKKYAKPRVLPAGLNSRVFPVGGRLQYAVMRELQELSKLDIVSKLRYEPVKRPA